MEEQERVNIDKSPVSSSGPAFTLRKLVLKRVSPAEFRYVPRAISVIFYLFLWGIGCGALILALKHLLQGRYYDGFHILMGAGCFLLFGYATRMELLRPRSFRLDRSVATLPVGLVLAKAPPISVPFKEVAALQVLEKMAKQKRHEFKSYELNLVRRDGARFTIVDHGNVLSLVEDANKLAQFLGCPVIIDAKLPGGASPVALGTTHIMG